MTIQDVVAIAQRIHDAEGVNLGAGSTREYRNAFWARAIGIVHHGHATYNPTPDPQWHIKDGGNGRPQSDDVVVSMPSRQYWDCIPGAGATGYSFRAQGPEILPGDQNVYPPPIPAGGGGVVTPPGPSAWTAAHSARLAQLPPDTKVIAEDFAFAFPSESWGQKKADPSRPVSSDVIARQLGGNLEGYRVVPKPSGVPQAFNLAGQVFVSVTPTNHLSGQPGPVPVPPVTPPPPARPICPDPSAHDPRPVPPYFTSSFFNKITERLTQDYREAGRPGMDEGSGYWIWVCYHDCYRGGMSEVASIAKHRAEWRQALGLPA